MKKLCRNCDERVPEEQTFLSGRTVGGSCNRAPRRMLCVICVPCAIKCVEHSGTHAMATSNRWDSRSLQHKLKARGIDVVLGSKAGQPW